jgi:FlaA1/EpsC-like NDP-sugar epimerase
MSAIRTRHLLWLPLLAAIVLAYAGAFLLRYDFRIPPAQYNLFEWGLLGVVVVKPPVFWAFRLHTRNWRLVGLFELCAIGAACTVAALVLAVPVLFSKEPAFSPSIYVLDGLLCLMLTATLQFSGRLFREVFRPNAFCGKTKSILVYGAGEAGLQLTKELRAHPRWGAAVAGFLDDDEARQGSSLLGLPVLGRGRDAAAIVARFERRYKPIAEIVIAMPSATGLERRTAIANCRAAGVSVKILPSVSELLEGKVVRQIREVAPEDLLGREPVQIEESRIADSIAGKTVLVTGGCGSIGAEICRQTARFHPGKLVVLDQAESESFMLAMNLRAWHPALNLATEIGDIVSAQRVDEVMRRHKPDLVFHAAAYKHVPLMEDHILEAVSNNVTGTYNVALAAHRHGVRKFVLISSDKAVNPTSVMGLTKRVAELLVSAMPLDDSPRLTRFVSVRFGNVLGSSGSVVQIFKRQIAAGGPVTITHPEMRRYFMSISEAVQLVLQASVMAKGSEVFVLDMGEPVLIMDLARNMIRLAGFLPDEDIAIRTTGLRPGEKLFEELRLQDENHLPTDHQKITRFSSRTLNAAYMAGWLEELQALIRRRDPAALLHHMRAIVPEYQGAPESVSSADHKEVAVGSL